MTHTRRLGLHGVFAFRASAALSAVALAMACGGDPGGGVDSCGEFTPCGGDPSGTWQSVSTCGDVNFDSLIAARVQREECPDALRVDAVTINGTIAFTSGNYSESASIVLNWTMRFDRACIGALAGQSVTSDGVGIFCTALRDELLNGEGSGFSSADCAATTTECACEAVSSEAFAASGAFQVDGDTLRFDASARQFCARGDELVLELPSMGMAADMAVDMGSLRVRYERIAR